MSTTLGSPPDKPEIDKPETDKPQQPRRLTLAGLAESLKVLADVLTNTQAVIIAGAAVAAAIIALVPRIHLGPTTPPESSPSLSPSALSAPPSALSAPPSAVSASPSASHSVNAGCLDQLTAPPESGTQVPISATLTCPVHVGNTIYLISEIKNADGRGDTEYYIATNWSIKANSSQEQAYCAHASAGITRAYYLISASNAQLAQIKQSELSDGGATTLAGAAIVSNHQPNKTNGSAVSC